MKKINLIRNQTAAHQSANINKFPEGVPTVWYISKHQNNTTYYVKEVDKENGAIKWTTHRSKSMQFHTENGVHHFIHSYMKDRHDIYLIHAPEESR